MSTKAHTHTLEQDVLAQRNTEVVTERRQQEREERQKRRKTGDASAIQLGTSTEHAVRPAGRQDAREAGLMVWREAHQRRKVKERADADANQLQTILHEAREQRAQIRREERAGSEHLAGAHVEQLLRQVGGHAEGESDDSDDDEIDQVLQEARQEDGADFLDAPVITEEEERALHMFGSGGTDANTPAGGKIMLADVILAKIEEKAAAKASAAELAELRADPVRAEREAKVEKVYNLVGNIMSKYRSGKVPKAFKIIPKVANWQHLLDLTRPVEWSPAAMYVATRLLSSSLSGSAVTGFYTDVLLVRCLDDITENRRLNYHLYQALAQSVYKPDAFVKGILFPVCEDGGVTLRQAAIISSVVSRVSIPMLHSAAALLYICSLEFRPACCLLLTALVEKKYALPYRVIDGIVEWFVRMQKVDVGKQGMTGNSKTSGSMPLMWHQCLLAFAQRYKMQLTAVQKEALKGLMRIHTHHAVTPEIRRELFSARNRGDVLDPDANTIARSLANAAAMVD